MKSHRNTWIITVLCVLIVGGGLPVLALAVRRPTVAIQDAAPTPLATATPQDWKVCRNRELGVSLEYPAGWSIYISGGFRGPAKTVNSCETDAPYGFFLTPLTTRQQLLNVTVCNTDCLARTVYKGIGTVDEYLARTPSGVASNPITNPHSSLGGEKAIRFKDGSIVAFHSGTEYVVSVGKDTDTDIARHFLQSFTFFSVSK
jgi:hypothetical protein